jgi:hypothetical protein
MQSVTTVASNHQPCGNESSSESNFGATPASEDLADLGQRPNYESQRLSGIFDQQLANVLVRDSRLLATCWRRFKRKVSRMARPALFLSLTRGDVSCALVLPLPSKSTTSLFGPIASLRYPTSIALSRRTHRWECQSGQTRINTGTKRHVLGMYKSGGYLTSACLRQSHCRSVENITTFPRSRGD